MRCQAVFVLLTIAVLTSGCSRPTAEEDADGGDVSPVPQAPSTASSPTPGPSPAPDPTPTSSPTPAPATRPSTEPPAGAPEPEGPPPGLEVFNGSFDFSGNAALVPLTASDTFEVPEGHTRLVVVVHFTQTGPSAPTDSERTVGIAPPGQTLALLSTGNTGGNSSGTIRAPADAGTWTLRYSGSGETLARITATVYREGEEPN